MCANIVRLAYPHDRYLINDIIIACFDDLAMLIDKWTLQDKVLLPNWSNSVLVYMQQRKGKQVKLENVHSCGSIVCPIQKIVMRRYRSQTKQNYRNYIGISIRGFLWYSSLILVFLFHIFIWPFLRLMQLLLNESILHNIIFFLSFSAETILSHKQLYSYPCF